MFIYTSYKCKKSKLCNIIDIQFSFMKLDLIKTKR